MGEVRTLLDGRGLVESPRWHGDRLYFSDWSAGEVVAVGLDGAAEVVARVRSLPLCTAWLDDRLMIVSSADGRLLRRDPDGTLVAHAELGPSGWNDVVADGRGGLYVNAVGFDPMSGEVSKPGSVSLVADGSVRQVADDIAFPNGMAVTPDKSTLIVADSYRHNLVAFDIDADGGLSGRRVWADLGEAAAPDGICVDAEDAVWYADVPNRRCVRVAEGGEILQTVHLDRGGFACALGGPDGRTLFITAAEWRGMTETEPVAPGSGRILATEVDVPGAGRR
ncbi:SMP-30/gluconolactonase/LRE family protein [Actinomadura formosensis]|uniref:SMP-30/gluconolactonase/LRE family protein n=1 Tax=Actinomadura formosensis TaxID=60706 RepID=UPI00082EB110|nr:SMP-30/gluconolactonase/LRE family protein [Actinomadura formosensis]